MLKVQYQIATLLLIDNRSILYLLRVFKSFEGHLK